MTPLDDNLSRLRTSVEAGLSLKAEPDNLFNYLNTVVTSHLDQVLRDLRTRIEKPHMLDESEVGQPNVAIHYTSIATLVSMLQGAADEEGSSSLRLYNSNHFNDPDEGNYFDRIIRSESPLLCKLLDTTYSPHAYVASFIVPNDKGEESASNIQKNMSDNLVFWRTYGREGIGCSLTLVIPRNRLRKVLYGRKAVRRVGKILSPVLASIHDCLSPLFELSLPLDIEHHLKRTIAGHIDRIRYLYKSEAYDYERECRIVVPEVDAQEDLITFQCEEREGSNIHIKHYYEVEELRVQEIFLTGSLITFGPRVSKPDNMRYYFESLLRKIDRFYGPKFKTSQIPYQPTV